MTEPTKDPRFVSLPPVGETLPPSVEFAAGRPFDESKVTRKAGQFAPKGQGEAGKQEGGSRMVRMPEGHEQSANSVRYSVLNSLSQMIADGQDKEDLSGKGMLGRAMSALKAGDSDAAVSAIKDWGNNAGEGGRAEAERLIANLGLIEGEGAAPAEGEPTPRGVKSGLTDDLWTSAVGDALRKEVQAPTAWAAGLMNMIRRNLQSGAPRDELWAQIRSGLGLDPNAPMPGQTKT